MAITHMSFTAANPMTTARVDIEVEQGRATISGTEFGTIQMSTDQSRCLYEALAEAHSKPEE